MARKCPDCGHVNEDAMSFCTECGEPLDPQVRLVMELEGKKAPTSYSGVRRAAATAGEENPRSRRHNDDDDDDDDDDYTPISHAEEEKKSPIGLIIGLAVVAAVVWFLFFR